VIAAFSPFLALRYLLTRRINLLAMFGVTFAVWAMIVVNSVFTGFVSEIRTDVRRATPAVMLTDLPLDTGYETLRAVLARDAAVAATAPRLRHHGLLQPLRVPNGLQPRAEAAELQFDHMESGFALLLGIDPLLEVDVTPLQQWIARSQEVFALHGHWLPPSQVLEEPDPARRAQLMVSDATEWHARRRAGLRLDTPKSEHHSTWPGVLFGWRRAAYTSWLSQGDPIDLLAAASVVNSSGTPQLRTHRMRVAFAGWFASGYRAFDETTVLLPIETVRTMLGQDQNDPNSIDLVTDVAIRLQPDLPPAAVATAMVRLQAAAQAVLPAGSKPCSVLDWQQQNTVFLSAVATEQAMMQFVLFVVMLVAAFVIYAVLHMMVVQKWKDIGILSALGGTPRAVGAVFLLCGLVVAVLGTVLGTALGTLSALCLNDANEWLFATTGLELFPRRLFDLQQVPVRLDATWLLQVASGAIVFAVLVALFPARKAARMNPVQAFAHE
jgi:lipoprotein-releasing system permease protein